MLTASQIREQFPRPNRPSVGPYCVGGACVLALIREGLFWPTLDSTYPSLQTLSHALQVANPHLSLGEARLCAASIVMANDRGLFDSAWYCLNEALTLHTHPVPMVVMAPASMPDEERELAMV